MLLILIMIILFILYFLLDEKKYLKWGIVISFILIATIFALRNNLGMDDERYRHLFDIIATKNTKMYWDLAGVEKSYFILCFLFSSIGLNYKSLFVFYALISFFFLILIAKNLSLSKNHLFIWILCFMAFCFTPYLTVMRQFAASTISIYAIIKFDNNNFVKPFLLFVIAQLIHSSAMILLPFCFIKNIHFKKEIMLYVLLPLIGLLISITPFWQFVGDIAEKLNLGGYFTYINNTNGSLGGTGIMVFSLYIIYALSLLWVYHSNRERIYNPTINLFAKLGSMFFFLFFLTQKTGYLGRIYYPFYLFEGVSLITILNCLPKSKKRYIAAAICVILSIITVYNASKIGITKFNFDNFSIDVITKDITDDQSEQ